MEALNMPTRKFLEAREPRDGAAGRLGDHRWPRCATGERDTTQEEGAGPYWCAAARRAYLVVPEIGVLKWLLEIRKNGSVNLEINGRF